MNEGDSDGNALLVTDGTKEGRSSTNKPVKGPNVVSYLFKKNEDKSPNENK